MKPKAHQKLPRTGVARETLRQKGQFWTPPWVADPMAAYALQANATSIFDPAVGAGAFFHAAKRVATGREIKLLGTELYEAALETAVEEGLRKKDLAGVRLGDFLALPMKPQAAIVGNPPYLRHHRILKATKDSLQAEFRQLSGLHLDGRAGLHVYFLIRALEMLAPKGRLAFILPADTFEGVFSTNLMRWIASRYRFDAVVVFDADATPFPGVDTNPVVLMIRNEAPSRTLRWCRCRVSGTKSLLNWVNTSFRTSGANDLEIVERDLDEGLVTGLTRPPAVKMAGFPLSRFARTMRGVASGENDFFFLTHTQITQHRLPEAYFVRALGRTRDASSATVTKKDLEALDDAGRPTYLLSLGDQDAASFPKRLREYLQEGERRVLPKKALISQRRPWYRMETRVIPPILFAYLGRRNARFIRNFAKAIPLTGFLCIYPKVSSPEFVERLFGALSDPRTVQNLGLVGKSYGGGAIKVEPRSLERLTIPLSVVKEFGLEAWLQPEQAALAF